MKVVLGLMVLFMMIIFGFAVVGSQPLPLSLQRPGKRLDKSSLVVVDLELEEQCHRQVKGGDLTDHEEGACWLMRETWMSEIVRQIVKQSWLTVITPLAAF